jgi:hypothetical protein
MTGKKWSKAHNPHLSAVLTPSPFIKVEGKGLSVAQNDKVTKHNTSNVTYRVIR